MIEVNGCAEHVHEHGARHGVLTAAAKTLHAHLKSIEAKLDILVEERSVRGRVRGRIPVEVDVATTTGVIARQNDGVLIVTNANPYPVAFEGKLGDRDLSGFTAKVRKKDGAWLWAVAIPANGTVTLGYREKSN